LRNEKKSRVCNEFPRFLWQKFDVVGKQSTFVKEIWSGSSPGLKLIIE